MNMKEELAQKAEITQKEVKLKKSMSISDMIRALQPGNKESIALCGNTGKIYQNGIVSP